MQELAQKLGPDSVALHGISQWITQGPNPRFVEDGKACLNGRNVAGGWISEENPNFVTEEEFVALRRYRLKNGDILITPRLL
jgi:hypothetical protein